MAESLNWIIREYGTVTSTQDVARELALSGAAEGTVVLAEHQSRGRGREGRKWYSPPDSGIWATCILRPKVASGRLPLLSMAVSVSIAAAIEALTGRTVSLKWPNDVYMGGRKLGGVLCEAETNSRAGTLFVLAGFGINLRDPLGGFAREIAGLATSLESETGSRFEKAAVLSSILVTLEKMYDCLCEDRGMAVIEEARARDMLRGSNVKLRVGTRIVEGEAVGLGGNGGLLLARVGQDPMEFTSGEVIEVSRSQGGREGRTS